MHVLIATPTTGGTVTSALVHTVVNATQAIAASGGQYSHISIDSAGIVAARNALSHMFLASPATHILFLDSDMAVAREVFAKLLSADLPMIGAVYAERQLDLERFAKHFEGGGSFAKAKATASTFAVQIPPGQLAVRGQICAVDGVGFGCVLLQRSVFKTIAASGFAPARTTERMRRHGIDTPVQGFFDEITDPAGEPMSEDYSFCHRARMSGITVNAYVGPGVDHIGQFAFGAALLDKLTE